MNKLCLVICLVCLFVAFLGAVGAVTLFGWPVLAWIVAAAFFYVLAAVV